MYLKTDNKLLLQVLLEGQIIKQSYESAHLGDNLRHSKPSGSKTPKSSTVDDTPTKSSVLMGFLHSKLQGKSVFVHEFYYWLSMLLGFLST